LKKIWVHHHRLFPQQEQGLPGLFGWSKASYTYYHTKKPTTNHGCYLHKAWTDGKKGRICREEHAQEIERISRREKSLTLLANAMSSWIFPDSMGKKTWPVGFAGLSSKKEV
jgi:hypothetical protein